MREVLEKISRFIGTLSVRDIIIFVLIMGAIIIGITLMYIFRNRNKGIKSEKIGTKLATKDDLLNLLPDDNQEEVVKSISDLSPVDDEPETLLDLATLTKALENQSYDHIDMEKYEREEEERAIISYDELLENTSNLKINYEEEIKDDGISVKKVDLNNLTSVDDSIPNKTTKVQLVSYEKEEAFLQALKDLQQLLQ